MQTIKSVSAMQRQARLWQRAGIRIGFVPTMGYLHEGHLSLVRRARQAVGKDGRVVVSIYVNPTQFGPQEDLMKYPRDLPRDLQLCRKAGVDVAFVPRDDAMYPGGLANRDEARAFSTFVVEEKLSQRMEGDSRPTHFRGVTTVVGKLFNLVLPEVAVFGAKDYQQSAVIRRMVRDLNFPVRIIVAPTRREHDGLAMSSRNKYLAGDQRRQAAILSQTLRQAQKSVRATKGGVAATKLLSELKARIESEPDVRLDYAEVFDPETLEPSPRARRGTHLALAAFVGKTRLIDNARL